MLLDVDAEPEGLPVEEAELPITPDPVPVGFAALVLVLDKPNDDPDS